MTPSRCSLLIVDDEPALLRPLKHLLSPRYEVLTAGGADEAEAVLAGRDIHLLLTDQRMPRRSGVHLLEWAHQHSPRTIRLLMTGYTELEDAVDAINRGHVYYYLVKPWRTEDLLTVLRNAEDKWRLERSREQLLEQLQKLNRELEQRVAERTRELEDANQLLQQRARELQRLALTDPLTGLFNRRAIDDLIQSEMKRHDRYPNALAVGYIDVDHFKEVNSRYLLTGGDEALKGLARILASTIRVVDSVGRVGGEEFMVLARETNLDGAQVLSERIRSAVEATPIRYLDREIAITVSAGFVVLESGVPGDEHEITKQAAEALDHAKRTGRNRSEVRLFQPARKGTPLLSDH